MKSGFTILEHPADLGIEAYGSSIKEAFENAAKGLMSIIVEISSVDCQREQEVHLNAIDTEQLLVKWLSEILYLYDGKQFVSKEFRIIELSSNKLNAIVRGESLSAEKHRTKLDVKAITYHQLLVQNTEHGCMVRVFLDI